MSILEFPISNRTKNAFFAAGYATEEDFKDSTIEKLKDVEGIGTKGIVEIREYLHSKFGIVIKHKPKDKKISNAKDCRAIISYFLGHRKFIKWASEMLVAQKLLAKYSLEFLLSVKPNYRASSLVFFLCPDGQKYLNEFSPSLEVESAKSSVPLSKESHPLEEVKLDQSLLDYKPPKSIKDFLK